MYELDVCVGNHNLVAIVLTVIESKRKQLRRRSLIKNII